MNTVPKGYKEPEIGDHVEEKKLDIQNLYCPARRFYPDGPSYCVDDDDEKRVCVLEGGYYCDRRMELIKEEKSDN